jgi:hypothetical protein
MIDAWNAGKGFSYLYTTSKDFADTIKKDCGHRIMYEQNGKVFAWQFLVPSKRVKFYLRLFEVKKVEYSAVANQGVTDMRKRKFRLRDANHLNLVKLVVHHIKDLSEGKIPKHEELLKGNT